MFNIIEEIVLPNGEVKGIRGPSLDLIRSHREQQLAEREIEFVEDEYYCIHCTGDDEDREVIVLARVDFTHKGKLTESVIDEYRVKGRLWVLPMTHLNFD